LYHLEVGFKKKYWKKKTARLDNERIFFVKERAIPGKWHCHWKAFYCSFTKGIFPVFYNNLVVNCLTEQQLIENIQFSQNTKTSRRLDQLPTHISVCRT